MAATGVAQEFYESSKLAKFPFEPYWPEGPLRICVTGAGGFIASHLAKRLKSEGHYIIGVDWKRNEHMPVSFSIRASFPPRGKPRQATQHITMVAAAHRKDGPGPERKSPQSAPEMP